VSAPFDAWASASLLNVTSDPGFTRIVAGIIRIGKFLQCAHARGRCARQPMLALLLQGPQGTDIYRGAGRLPRNGTSPRVAAERPMTRAMQGPALAALTRSQAFIPKLQRNGRHRPPRTRDTAGCFSSPSFSNFVKGGESMRRSLVSAILAAALSLAIAAPAFADPAPPTNGGNGAGQSGQCTGPQQDRPSSCQSQGGPGNQP
jgi:uncharacterized membrane protein